jgi:hypothetical protein
MENNRDERLHDVVSRAFLWEGLPSIAVHEWGRDCDQFESTNAFLLSIDLPPSNGGGMNKGGSAFDEWLFNWPEKLLEQYLERELSMENNKEGPCSMHIMTKADYLEFRPHGSDRRAEQYGY